LDIRSLFNTVMAESRLIGRWLEVRMRIEHDLLADKAIPDELYYGVQTARALENFHISGVPISQYPDLIRALAMVKLAAARANYECGQFGEEILHGIEGACQELIDGRLHEQFKVDLIQGGAGTSTNMAANEVIANRALEFMGFAKGQYQHCDPHNHVNCSQSTNDAYWAYHLRIVAGHCGSLAQGRRSAGATAIDRDHRIPASHYSLSNFRGYGGVARIGGSCRHSSARHSANLHPFNIFGQRARRARSHVEGTRTQR
jgi:hypothetical protein